MRRPDWLVLLALAAVLPLAAAARIQLQGPLTTVWDLRRDGRVSIDGMVQALRLRVQVPDDAPSDLGIGAWCSDRHGRWFQTLHPGPLTPGAHDLELAFDRPAPEPVADAWRPDLAKRVHHAGILFFTASRQQVAINLQHIEAVYGQPGPEPTIAPDDVRLLDLQLPELRDGAIAGHCGERLELRCLPEPFPNDPYAVDSFRFELVVQRPDDRVERVPGFFIQDRELHERGDLEEAVIAAPGRFAVRYRPRVPGKHLLTLEASWEGGEALRVGLPDLQADGAAWDDIVRVDPVDKRFFATGVEAGRSRFYWPIGLNIRSLYDTRSNTNKNFTTLLTQDRGSLAYAAYLQRLAAAGGTAAEIWMSSWNLALEWRAEWPGYHGIGAYNQDNATRLDAILDEAQGLGIRINLVINNHGQASAKSDREWTNNPYSEQAGGFLPDARQFFTSEKAKAYQQRLRRYIIARYADHPAILGWKLFSEINLTAADSALRTSWFKEAAARWQQLDVYRHPTTIHWSGDFRTPDRSICALDEAEYICIDAYHGRRRKGRRRTVLIDLIADGMQHPTRNLGQFNKPLLVTEFGGSHKACPEQQLIAEHRSGGWAGLVSGNAGAPMLWWWEWVDQHDQWHPYGALSSFIAGEDLRSTATSRAWGARLTAQQGTAGWWAGAWVRQGRLLGYLADIGWASTGVAATTSKPVHVVLGDNIGAGGIEIEWWNATTGEVIQRRTINHKGGRLRVGSPPVTDHIAFKMWRR